MPQSDLWSLSGEIGDKSQDKELQKLGRRRLAEDTAPDDRGAPITDALPDWKSMANVPRVLRDNNYGQT